jgi:pyruvate,orthophosphate dikinase
MWCWSSITTLFEEALEIAKEDRAIISTRDVERAETGRRWSANTRSWSRSELGQAVPAGCARAALGRDRRGVRQLESDRAKVYRRLNDIPGDWGTAVNVQAMVFGNMGDTSATGVAFTRDPATGERAYYGEYLINAQGEDVVAGIRTPQYLTKAARERAGASRSRWKRRCRRLTPSWPPCSNMLETHYRDMQDIEFTVERASSGCCRPAPASAPPRPR